MGFQTLEVLKVARSASEDELWLFSAGAVEQPMRYDYIEPLRDTFPKLPEDAEFGNIITADSRSGKPTSITNVFSSIFVLQDIITVVLSCHRNEYDVGKVFFSALGSLSTITDGILRKLRGFLMVISLDCTKLELLGDGNFNSSSDKSKDKFSACSRKKKGRSRNIKKQNLVLKTEVEDLPPYKHFKVLFFFIETLLDVFLHSFICVVKLYFNCF